MANIPCKSPSICGVQSHKPGTKDLKCQNVKSARLGGAIYTKTGIRSPVQPSSASPEYPLYRVEEDTQKLKDSLDYRLRITQKLLDSRRIEVSNLEFIIELADDHRVVALKDADVYDPEVARQLRRIGVSPSQFDEVREAIDWRSDSTRALLRRRIGALASEPYIRQYADEATALEIEDEAADTSEPINNMRDRMAAYGVLQQDVNKLIYVVRNTVKARNEKRLTDAIERYPAAKLPDFEPFNVELGLEREKAGFAAEQKARNDERASWKSAPGHGDSEWR